MPEIRILVVHPAGILRDIIVTVLNAQDDMTVVDQLPDHTGLREALASARPTLIIFGQLSPDVLEVYPDLFASYPALKVLAVREDGRQGFLWELRPHRTPLGEISPTQLVEVIRERVLQ
jgi:DNA-binding NarL/FixJ family response regulator